MESRSLSLLLLKEDDDEGAAAVVLLLRLDSTEVAPRELDA